MNFSRSVRKPVNRRPTVEEQVAALTAQVNTLQSRVRVLENSIFGRAPGLPPRKRWDRLSPSSPPRRFSQLLQEFQD